MTAAAASAVLASLAVDVHSADVSSDSAAAPDDDWSAVSTSSSSFTVVAETEVTGVDEGSVAALPPEPLTLEPSPLTADEGDAVAAGGDWGGVESVAGKTSSTGSACGSAPPTSSTGVRPVLVCAPPLLLTITPGATSLLVAVSPAVLDAVVSRSDGEPSEVGSLSAAAPGEVVGDDGDDASVDVSFDDVDSELVDAELDDSELDPLSSALAKLGEAMIIAPKPNAAASAPTRPT